MVFIRADFSFLNQIIEFLILILDPKNVCMPMKLFLMLDFPYNNGKDEKTVAIANNNFYQRDTSGV